MELVKDTWKWILISILLVVIYFLFNRIGLLDEKIKDASLKAKEHETKAVLYKKIYDDLIQKDSVLEVKYDSLFVEKNKLKIIYNEKIKLVNKYSVSDMQHYFNERTK